MRKSIVVTVLCSLLFLAATVTPASARPTPNRWTFSQVPGLDPQGFTVHNFGLYFVDDDHGWMCGEDGSMQVTADGGLTWSAQNTGVTTNIADVYFVDLQHGWAVSGQTLLSTVDGGSSWQTATLEFGASTVEFVDATHGWLAAHGTVMTTSDGGATWTPRSAPSQQYVYVGGFDAVDAEYAWYWVGGTAYETRDGGSTWTQIFATDGAHGYSIDDIALVDRSHGFILSDGWVHVAAATDPLTWETHRVADIYSDCRIAATDAQRAWIMGAPGVAYATDDGGVTWFWQGADDSSGVFDLQVRGDRGWACGSGYLSTTRTGYSGMRPPETSSDLPAYLNHSLLATLSATDDRPGTTTTYFHLDDAEWQEGTSVGVLAPGDHSGDGYHRLHMYSVDADGNDEMTVVQDVVIDTVAPGLSVAPEEKYMLDYWYNVTSRLRLWANDPAPGSGGSVEVDFDDAGWVDLGRSAEWVTEAPKDHTNDGVHTLDLRTVDGAGNQSAVESHVVCLDTRKPAAKAPYSCTVRRGAYATLKFKIVDGKPCYPKGAVGFLVTKLNGRPVMRMLPKKWYAKNTMCSYRFKCWPAKGTYYFYVYVADGAGNVDPTPARNKLYIK